MRSKLFFFTHDFVVLEACENPNPSTWELEHMYESSIRLVKELEVLLFSRKVIVSQFKAILPEVL